MWLDKRPHKRRLYTPLINPVLMVIFKPTWPVPCLLLIATPEVAIHNVFAWWTRPEKQVAKPSACIYRHSDLLAVFHCFPLRVSLASKCKSPTKYWFYVVCLTLYTDKVLFNLLSVIMVQKWTGAIMASHLLKPVNNSGFGYLEGGIIPFVWAGWGRTPPQCCRWWER